MALSVRAVVSGAFVLAVAFATVDAAQSLEFGSSVTVSTVTDELIVPMLGRIALGAFAFSCGVIFVGPIAMVLVVPTVAIWAWIVRTVARER